MQVGDYIQFGMLALTILGFVVTIASLKKDKEVVLTAIRNSVSTLEYADLSLRKDKDFMIQAIRISREAFNYIDISLSGDEDIIKEFEKNN